MTVYRPNNTSPPSGKVKARQQRAGFAFAAIAALAGASSVAVFLLQPSSAQPIMLEVAGDMLRLCLAVGAVGMALCAMAVHR